MMRNSFYYRIVFILFYKFFYNTMNYYLSNSIVIFNTENRKFYDSAEFDSPYNNFSEKYLVIFVSRVVNIPRCLVLFVLLCIKKPHTNSIVQLFHRI